MAWRSRSCGGESLSKKSAGKSKSSDGDAGEGFYRTVIEVEVLTEGEYYPGSLEDVARDIVYGDASGDWSVKSSRRVSRKTMARLLEKQGSDPSFLLGDDDE